MTTTRDEINRAAAALAVATQELSEARAAHDDAARCNFTEGDNLTKFRAARAEKEQADTAYALAALEWERVKLLAALPAEPTPEPAPLKVGDWVEATADYGIWVKKGARGQIMRPGADPACWWVMWHTGEFAHSHGRTGNDDWSIRKDNVKRIDPPAPVAPEPRWKVGQVVMVPMRITGIMGDKYECGTLGVPDSGGYMGRRELDRPAPEVGAECWFWDEDGDEPVKGKLLRIDDDDLPYITDAGEKYYCHCVRA